MKTGFLKLCTEALFDFINPLLEADINEPVNVGGQLEIAFVQNCDTPPAKTNKKHAKLKYNVLPCSWFYLVCLSKGIPFVVGG